MLGTRGRSSQSVYTLESSSVEECEYFHQDRGDSLCRESAFCQGGAFSATLLVAHFLLASAPEKLFQIVHGIDAACKTLGFRNFILICSHSQPHRAGCLTIPAALSTL